eukprot:sb/3465595/
MGNSGRSRNGTSTTHETTIRAIISATHRTSIPLGASDRNSAFFIFGMIPVNSVYFGSEPGEVDWNEKEGGSLPGGHPRKKRGYQRRIGRRLNLVTAEVLEKRRGQQMQRHPPPERSHQKTRPGTSGLGEPEYGRAENRQSREQLGSSGVDPKGSPMVSQECNEEKKARNISEEHPANALMRISHQMERRTFLVEEALVGFLPSTPSMECINLRNLERETITQSNFNIFGCGFFYWANLTILYHVTKYQQKLIFLLNDHRYPLCSASTSDPESTVVAYQTPLIVQPPPILELQIEMEVRRADFALTPPREIVPPVSPALSLETVSPELHILMDTSTEHLCRVQDVQTDPDLVTSSGERILGTKSGLALNRGQIPLIFYIGGNLSCH